MSTGDDLIKDIKNLKRELETQIDVINTSTGKLHNRIIEIASKSAEYKDLIQFIVEINDRMENKERQITNILCDTINELATLQEKCIKLLESESVNYGQPDIPSPTPAQTYTPQDNYIPEPEIDYKPSKNKEPNIIIKVFNFIWELRNNQNALIMIFIIVIVIGMILSPDNILKLLRELKEIFIGSPANIPLSH